MQRLIDTGLIVLLLVTLATPGTIIPPAAIAHSATVLVP